MHTNSDGSLRKKRLEDLIYAAKNMDRQTLQYERELMNVKWFEYRFLSPVSATRLFAQFYTQKFKQFIRSNVDLDLSENVKGLPAMVLFKGGREATQLWKARQRADATGMSYPAYLTASFNFAANRKRKMAPRPNQLHHPGQAEVAWVAFRESYWKDFERGGGARVANLAAYRVENYQGLPPQKAYRQYLLNWAKRNLAPAHQRIVEFCLKRRQMPTDGFAALYPEELYRQQLEYAESEFKSMGWEPEPLPVSGSHDLWPTCFGLPYALQPGAEPCRSCSLQSSCKLLGDGVLKKMASKPGTQSTPEDRKREKARERKRRQRAREAAAKSEVQENVKATESVSSSAWQA